MNHSIGIDVGKRELVAGIRSTDGNTAIPAPFPNTSMGFRKLVVHFKRNKVGKDDPVLLESTGPYHWNAAQYLRDKGYAVRVANPLHTKQMARHSIRKRKTDKIDATHLAFLASQGYGYPFVETAEMAKKKALVRHYFKMRQFATRALLHERYLKEYRGVDDHAASAFLVAHCKDIRKQIEDEWGGNDVKYLDSIPGVTPFLAATILAEVTPLDRFERIDQVIAFAGLDPSVRQTGGKPGLHGKLSKRGSPLLRYVLFMAAFGAFAKPGPMRELYMRYKEKGHHHNTILCILARKILRTSVALLRKRRVFDERKFLTSG